MNEIPDVPKTIAEWLACAAFLSFLLNEGRRLVKWVVPAPGEPSNEILGEAKKGLSRRLHVVEGSISKIYGMLTKQEKEFGEKLAEQTLTILRAGDSRGKELKDSIEETTQATNRLAVKIGALEERTKHL